MMLTELKRAFANRLLVVALLIGMACALAQLVVIVVPYGLGEEWVFWRAGSKGYYPNSLFNSWMGATPYSVWSVLYFFVLPLIACVPHADTLYSDMRSGYAAHVVVRGGAIRYMTAKVVSVFLTAGVVGTAPQLANLLGTMLLVPVFPPDPAAGTFFVSSASMLADVFYASPWAYVAFFLVLCFLVCGLVACSCLAFSYVVSNRFMVLVAPFIMCSIAFSHSVILPGILL